MNLDNKFKKFAKLIAEVGVNVQKNQIVLINAPVQVSGFICHLVEACYKAGASWVYVKWIDSYCNRIEYIYAEEEVLTTIPKWSIDTYKYLVENGACQISVTSPFPGLYSDCDALKIQKASIASSKAFEFYRKNMMANNSQWCVVAGANDVWAKKVFPESQASEANYKLWEAIFKASHVEETNDPVLEWQNINQTLTKRNEILNNYNFEKLIFKNSLGTNLEVGLVQNHIWAGGGEISTKGVFFNPNIPTEETFTMPHNKKTNGRVVATKPLNFQGKLIENFYLDFVDGKVVNFYAEKEQEALANLINYDEGSSRLGEVALISYDSPISKMNILFYNTLFDENASCHLALGEAYASTNLKDGGKLNKEELDEVGCNTSMTHVDFMFGSEDMEITGITYDNREIVIFKKGNFII